jgi:hypothetical protein
MVLIQLQRRVFDFLWYVNLEMTDFNVTVCDIITWCHPLCNEQNFHIVNGQTFHSLFARELQKYYTSSDIDI